MKRTTIQRIKLIATAIVLLAIMLFLISCSSFDDNKEEITANEYIYEAFEEWYLWYDELPVVDPNDYDSFASLIDTLTVDVDRWSFAGSYAEIMKLFESGEFKGFGAGFKIDYDKKIKITHVYNASPFGLLGIERGWVAESINGFTVNELDSVNKALSSMAPVDFVFTDYDNQQHQFTLQKEEFKMNTVMHSQVIEKEGKRIGYLVFDSFVDASAAELKPVIDTFKNQNITDLIVDLRYNGGGVNTIADMLVAMIGGDKVAGQVISTMVHNDKKSDRDKPTVSEYKGAVLDLETVYFITTSGTASASELVINSLTPFMEVKLVGSNTHGKPVGMYILSVKEIDLAILPISFKSINNLGYGDYFIGFPATIAEADDLSHNWGHPDESMLKAAVNDILYPAVAIASTYKSILIDQQIPFEYPGINQIVNAW